MMKKKRQLSGDSVSESSGYCSNSEGQINLGEYFYHCTLYFVYDFTLLLSILDDTLRKDEALKILSLNKTKGCPLQHCQNNSRGCQARSYPRVIALHQEMCKFPEVRKLTVKNKLNLLQADIKKFRIFCKSFDKSNKVMFLYKLTKDGTSIKIVAQHYANENFFTLTH